MVTLDASALRQYAAVSLYNSPYPAHAEGRAIDLYPGDGTAPSPVTGTVLETRSVRAPTREYGGDRDHLIVVDTGERLARILHVDPRVAPGDRIDRGDDLGETVRSGYFDPWVDDHIHLGFRPPEADPRRATGSLPVDLAVPIEPVAWDGTGRIVERGDCIAVLEGPVHPSPGDAFAGIAAGGGALDGGFPHYDRGGVIGGTAPRDSDRGTIEFGADVAWPAVARDAGVGDGRSIDWEDVEVHVDGRPIEGLSLALWRDRVEVGLVSRGDLPEVSDRVTVTVELRSPSRGGM